MVILNFLLLFLSIGVVIIFFGKIKLLDSSLDKERLKSEMILCEKLGLDKQILNFKKDMTFLKEKNSALEELYRSARMKLDIQEKELQKITHTKKQTVYTVK